MVRSVKMVSPIPMEQMSLMLVPQLDYFPLIIQINLLTLIFLVCFNFLKIKTILIFILEKSNSNSRHFISTHNASSVQGRVRVTLTIQWATAKSINMLLVIYGTLT